MHLQAALASTTSQSPILVDSSLQLSSLPSFFAIGDSYSAGIGANCGWVLDEFDPKGACLRCEGGYPYQIIEIANSSSTATNETEVFHVGCTGASMSDIINTGWNNRTSQLELMAPHAAETGWGTLSIGGNDVGFANIVANCIMTSRPSCEADMNLTESLIRDPGLIGNFTTTYLHVLQATHRKDFKLIVTSYAQFFNAETEHCEKQHFLYGRYLTRELRARVNQLVAELNVLIRVAVSIVQLQLVFSSSRKAIYFENWDELFDGHRFCEDSTLSFTDSWFFTIGGYDLLPNKTIVPEPIEPPPGERTVNLSELLESCDRKSFSDAAAQILCSWAENHAISRDSDGNYSTTVYPPWVVKTFHPKSIAHWTLAKVIYRKLMNGEYF